MYLENQFISVSPPAKPWGDTEIKPVNGGVIYEERKRRNPRCPSLLVPEKARYRAFPFPSFPLFSPCSTHPPASAGGDGSRGKIWESFLFAYPRPALPTEPSLFTRRVRDGSRTRICK